MKVVNPLMNNTVVRVGAVKFFRGRNPTPKERGFAETLVGTKNQKLNLKSCYRIRVSSPPFHGGNLGSNPSSMTINTTII